MGYLGNTPGDKFLTLEKQVFTTSATDTYVLDREVSSVNDIELFLNNVRQEPTEAYTISGTTLTLASAITASDSMYCIYQGRSVGTQAPATGSVTNGMLAGSIANDKLAGGIESSKLAFASYPYRNLIINGDMSIAQRGTSSTGVTGASYNACDRHYFSIDSAGTWTVSQDTDVPSGQGFSKSFKMACTTANTSLSAGSYCKIEHRLEGQMLQHLKKGTSNAESLTLSFWVKSNKTGTYVAELRDIDNSRHICTAYTISSADTWEKKTITYAGDTSGTLDNDNARSFHVNLHLVAGTNFSSGTLPSSWSNRSSANDAVGQVNLADSTSNYINITGVQLEVGTSASDFEFLPYDVNLDRCQRYYQETTTFHGHGHSVGNTAVGTLFFGTKMRASPSISATGVITITDGYSGDFTQSSVSVGKYSGTSLTYGYFITVSNFSGLTTNRTYFHRHNNSNRFTLDAEL